MAGYWLKLYTEILEDPKYYRLTDSAKLGMIELMLVAKKVGLEGEIPSIEDVAFYTRRTVEWWMPVFEELSKIEYLVINGSEMIIRKFAERQAAVDGTERQKKFREIKHKKEFVSRECNESVTERNGDSDTDTDTDTEVEAEADTATSPVQIMLEKITGIPPSNAGDIKAMTDIEKMNPLQEDIQEAFNWVVGQGTNVHRYSSLVNPIKIQIAKRVQKPKSNLDQSLEAIRIFDMEASDAVV